MHTHTHTHTHPSLSMHNYIYIVNILRIIQNVRHIISRWKINRVFIKND